MALRPPLHKVAGFTGEQRLAMEKANGHCLAFGTRHLKGQTGSDSTHKGCLGTREDSMCHLVRSCALVKSC